MGEPNSPDRLSYCFAGHNPVDAMEMERGHRCHIRQFREVWRGTIGYPFLDMLNDAINPLGI